MSPADFDFDAAPKRKAASSKAAPPVSPLIRSVYRPRNVAKMALLVGAVALAPYLVQKLPNLESRPEYRLQSRQIQVVPQPERPVPADLLEQVCKQNNVPAELSLLDETLAPNIAEAFSRHPWIEKVVSVRKETPARVTVKVRYRTLIAMVKVDGGHLPVDETGFVLPSADFSLSDIKSYPAIHGISGKKPSRAGSVWRDPSLQAATRLAKELGPYWKSLRLEAIVIPTLTESSKDPAKVQLALQTVGGSKVLWGRAPGSDHPGELTPVQKIERLEKYLAEFGGFDKPNGPYEIDIRHWQEISRRPTGTATTVISRGKEKVRR